MEIKAEKQHPTKSTVALVLAAAIILGSTVTAAAAAQSSDHAEQNSINAAQSNDKIEFELANGDMLVSRNISMDMSFEVLKAYTVTVDNCEKTNTVMIAKGTVADVLEKANITLDKNHIVIPSAKTQITGDTNISIYEAKKVSVTADGKTQKLMLPEGNIVDSLNKVKYSISDEDIINVSRDSKVKDNMSVEIQRVTYQEETTTEKIAYKSVQKNSDDIELGKTKISVKGKDGEKLVVKKCKYIDGKKVSDKVIETQTIKEPVDEVTLVGTKGVSESGKAGTFTDMNGKEIAYSRVITGSGTAYTAPAGARTATGVLAYQGGVAVNPNVIPYGSKLYITSTDGSFVYGYATAVDTGGALMEGSAVVDCFYNTYDECVNFGRRNVNVYIVG